MNGVQLPRLWRTSKNTASPTCFLPPTAIYVMLAHPEVRNYDYSSLDYFLYAAAPMSVDKLKEAIDVFGPVMAQSYGQAEAPMICTYMSARTAYRGARRPTRRIAWRAAVSPAC